MDATAVAAVDARLGAIAVTHGVRIPWAIESGSRAWGFPSPDSDYDCRFLFIRPQAAYLQLFPERDVIETPLEGELDVNGWDLPKVVRLLLKGNAVAVEWLTSPIIYQGDAAFRDRMLAMASEIIDRGGVTSHYLHVAYSMRNRVFADATDAPLKKLFYLLRPVVALRWLRLHPQARIAPMALPALMAEAALPSDVVAAIEQLLAVKARTRELGHGPVPQPLHGLIRDEIALAEGLAAASERPVAERRRHAEQAYRALLADFAPAQ